MKRKTNPRRVQSYLLDISVTAGAPAHGLGAAQLPISAQQPVSFPLVFIQLRPASLPTLPHPSPCPYQQTVRPTLFYLTFKFRSCHQRIQNRLDEWTHGSGPDRKKSVFRMFNLRERERDDSEIQCVLNLSWCSAWLRTTWPRINWDKSEKSELINDTISSACIRATKWENNMAASMITFYHQQALWWILPSCRVKGLRLELVSMLTKASRCVYRGNKSLTALSLMPWTMLMWCHFLESRGRWFY